MVDNQRRPFCRGRRSFCLNYYTRKYPVDDAYARPIGPDVVSAILICSRHGTQRCKTNLITLIFVLLFLRILLEVRIIEKVPSILGVRKNALQLDCIDEDHTDHSHAADGNVRTGHGKNNSIFNSCLTLI